ncbi:ABC transporter permease [Candidatus Bipolaricaulota bacterium]|nr:ABC transporter permease [Candidatus Bipolaricaulota bacterium]
MLKLLKEYTGAFLLLALFLLLWEVGVRLFNVPFYILPTPSRILLVFFTNLPLLLSHGSMTILEVAMGMLIGGVGGIVLALIIFYSPSLERAVYPLIIASQMIPIFAIAPLLVVWFGYGLWSKATVAALIVFFPIVVNAVDGLRSVSGETIDLLRSLHASEWQIFRVVRLPASLPSFFSGLKIGITLSVVGATIGEWIGAKKGLGYLMIQSNALLRIDLVFASILTLSLLGLFLFGALRIIEQHVLRWRTRVEVNKTLRVKQ